MSNTFVKQHDFHVDLKDKIQDAQSLNFDSMWDEVTWTDHMDIFFSELDQWTKSPDQRCQRSHFYILNVFVDVRDSNFFHNTRRKQNNSYVRK